MVRLRVALYCLLGGVVLLVPALKVGHLLWWYLSGVILAASFVPVALFGPGTVRGQFGIISPILAIVTVLTTWSEAWVFVKSPLIHEHPIRNLVSEIAFYLVVAMVLAVLPRALKLTGDSLSAVPRRSWAQTAGILVICAAAYMLYYLVTGAITYQWFTKVYYPEAAALVGRLGLWFWGLQIARGWLMTLAVVPLVYRLRMRRLETAICAGMLIWVGGGLAPLIVPNELMGSTQRFIHILEIFTQNFTLGLTAGLLLRPKSAAIEDPMRLSTAA
jgi:hypothetical protein